MSSNVTCRLCGETYSNAATSRCPLCGGSATEEDLLGSRPEGNLSLLAPDPSPSEARLRLRATEDLEAELSQRSSAIERHQSQFHQVRAELKRRRETRDEQPAPLTADQRQQDELETLRGQVRTLTNKAIAMEADQARLVVEAEMFKAQRLEAEERLALVVKRLPQKREPMTREAARELADRFKAQDNLGRLPLDWAIDAIVEASR